MDSSLATSIINSGSSSGIMVGTNIANNVVQKRMAETNFERNKEMAEYQWNKELEMWNRQNEYNSPKAQMQRYIDAGLNPNLVAGQGSSGNATTIPRYQAPEYKRNYIPLELPQLDVIGQYQNMQMRNEQIENLKQDRENKKTVNSINLWKAIMAEVKANLDKEWSYSERAQKYQGAGAQIYKTDEERLLKGLQRKILTTDFEKFWTARKASELLKSQADAQIAQNNKDISSVQSEYQKYLGSGPGRLAKESLPAISGFIGQIARLLIPRFAPKIRTPLKSLPGYRVTPNYEDFNY